VSVSHLQTTAIDRIPPHNLEAEMALIGSALVDREIMDTVTRIVQPSDFYAHVHETIFTVMYDLFDRGEPLDKIAIAEELRRRDALERVGGLSYLSSLMDTVQTAASAEYYAKIVREKSILRTLIHAGTQITQLGYEAEEDVEGALDRSEQLVYQIGERTLSGDFVPVNRLMKDAFDRIDRLFHTRGDRTGLTAGFHDIDQVTTGFQPGNFVIVAARPGMGKTSFALNMAVAAARESQGDAIAFFSLEMSNYELIQRLICSEARISMHDMRRGNIREHQWEDISRAMGALNDLPIYLDDSGGLTVTEVRSRCRRLKSTTGLAAIFVDYLQLLRPGVLSRNANRNEEISEICRTLKVTAKDLEVPIVALAQLNRAVEARSDKRPMLADLRDCLSGDALVLNADTGARLRVEDIVRDRLRFNVWAVDERLQLVRRPIADAWAVGEKQLYRLKTRSGRTICCTEGHRFLGIGGWIKLADLRVGRQIAVPRSYDPTLWSASEVTSGRALLLGWLIGDGWLGGSAALTVATTEEAELAAELGRREFGLDPVIKPERADTNAMKVVMTTGRMCGAGKNPLATWLRAIGAWNKTGARKSVPQCIFTHSDEVIASFLRGLFHADGSLSGKPNSSSVCVRLSTISERLARDVQHLLLRLGIRAWVNSDKRHIGGYRTATKELWTVAMTDRAEVASFLDRVGFLGKKHTRAESRIERTKQNLAGHVDRLPLVVNELVSELRRGFRYSHVALGWRDQGKAMSRATCVALAERLDDEELAILARSAIMWDEVSEIGSLGVETVYDLTVDDLHNFCVDDFITHNSGSLEQEADIVSFLYREGYYNRESAEPDVTEFIIAKHRNGPTHTVRLRFQDQYTLFVPYADDSHFPPP
jgi:replicative DNA helicase